MKNINSFLKDNITSVCPKNITVAPMIPEKKLNNAIKSFGYTKDFNKIVALYDNTIFGSGKDGMIFTGELLVYRESFADPQSVDYDNIKNVIYTKNTSVNEKGKEEHKEFVHLILKDDTKIKLENLSDCNYKKLSSILENIVNNFDEYKEEDQLLTLSEMSEQLKIAYVKIVVNMAYADDGKVDEKEFAEILMLMTRLYLSTGSRFQLRAYMTNESEIESLESLLHVVEKESPESQYKSVRISLVKDLISVYMSVNGGSVDNFEFFNKNKSLFGIGDEEIEFVIMAIETDLKMLKDDYSDDALQKGIKELTSKAAAVGVPLAAVYLSGSVIGMSAAGLTSGLATLGLGGVLGLSSMATGIGVAVLLGVGAYKGVRHLTGANELDKTQRRELMLHEVIKQTQSTISLLIEDINYIVEKLNQSLISIGNQEAQIKKLASMMSILTGAATVLNKKQEASQNSVIKLRCPKYLDITKLLSLTNEAVKKPLYDFIIGFYVEETYSEEKNGETVENTRHKIKEKIGTKELEELANAIEGIGYFKASEVLKGAAGDVVNKAKGRLTEFFSN